MKIKAYSTSLVLSVLVSINDANVLELIQKNNAELKQLQNKSLQSQLVFEKYDLNYAPYLNFDLSTEKDNTDTMTSQARLDTDKKKYTALLGKNFLTGTDISLEATQIDFRSGLNPLLATSNYSQNYVALNLEQSLYPNFFGSTTRSEYQSNVSQMQKDQLQALADQIDLTKTKLANYWKAKTLSLQVTKNKDLIEKYDLLNKKILQKTKNGLANPGELEQAQAELIQRKQNMSDDSTSLNTSIQQVREDLTLSSDQDIKIDLELQKVPALTKKNIKIENTLKYKLQKSKTEAAEAAYQAAQKYNAPEISLYGKYTQQGLEDKTSDSLDEFNHGEKNKYLVGLKLNYTFGSDVNDVNYRIQKQNYEIEKNKAEALNTDLSSYLNNLSQKLESAYNNIAAAEQILKLRYEINKKIRASYDQGRSDISLLIEAYNKTTTAEINLVTAYGLYSQLKYEYEAQQQ